MKLILQANSHNLRPDNPDMVDIRNDKGDPYAMTHIDLFWPGPERSDPNSLYQRLRRGETVTVSVEMEP